MQFTFKKTTLIFEHQSSRPGDGNLVCQLYGPERLTWVYSRYPHKYQYPEEQLSQVGQHENVESNKVETKERALNAMKLLRHVPRETAKEQLRPFSLTDWLIHRHRTPIFIKMSINSILAY